ncbi:MAG: hypothetical protein QXJ19_05675 [Candidatus Bathyarchaeia archaeon]
MAPAVKGFFGRTKRSLNEMLIESICELGKYYSRLELAYSKLVKRERELFNECIVSLSRGMRNKAVVYANEIAELRKLISTVQNLQLSLERAILRLETFKAVTPTLLHDIKGVFSDVKETLNQLAKVMPSLTPELNNFINSINDLLAATEIGSVKCEPTVVSDEATEAILKEALDHLKGEIERKIPEPPEGISLPEPPKAAIKPQIALTVDGAEAYVSEDGSIINVRSPSQSRIMEELVLDYIERNNGELNLSRCAEELKVPPDKIMEVIDSLSKRGIIRIE